MKLEYYSTEKFKRETSRIVKKHLNAEKFKVFIFGSRVKGDNSLRSDIDIGILGNVAAPVDAIFKIKEEFDMLPMLYKIDVVDFNKTSEKFKKEALKNIEYV